MASDAESIFKVFDKDNDGFLNVIEMHQALGASGFCPSIEDVASEMKVGDNRSEKGDLELFRKLRERFKSTTKSAEEILALFKVLDPANTGTIDVSSLEYLLCNFNEKLSHLEAKEFLFDALQSSQGPIHTVELSKKLAALPK